MWRPQWRWSSYYRIDSELPARLEHAVGSSCAYLSVYARVRGCVCVCVCVSMKGTTARTGTMTVRTGTKVRPFLFGVLGTQ